MKGRVFAPSRQQRDVWRSLHRDSLRVVLELEVEPAVSPVKFRDAIDRVVARHEILRTRVSDEVIAGVATQIVMDAEGTTALSAQHELGRLWTLSCSSAVADGRTMDLIASELDRALQGEDITVAMQYADYAGWLEERVAASSGLVLESPWSPWSPGREGYRPTRLRPTFVLDARLGDVARACETSEEDLLLAAWVAFLWRLDPVDAIPMAILTPGRTIDEFDCAIGPYDRYAVASIEVSRNLMAVVRRVQLARNVLPSVATECRRNAPVAFSARLAPPRLASLMIRDRFAVPHEVRIELDCVRSGDRWSAGLLFDAASISPAAAVELRDTFGAWVASSIDSIERDLEAIPLGDEVPRSAVSRGEAAVPAEPSFPALFELAACAHATRPAVVAEGQVLTYGELDRRSSALARRLLASGCRPGISRVAVSISRCASSLVAIVGVLRSGAAYVPLDPAWPVARMRELVALLGVDAIVIDGDTSDLGVPAMRLGRETSETWSIAIDPEWTAYVVSTSGSTGMPRGVSIPHRTLRSYLGAVGSLLQVRDRDRYLYTAAPAFSAAIRQLLVPLVSGACVVVASRGHLLEPTRLLALIASESVTVVDLVPSLWHRVARKPLCLDSVRLALSASEPLSEQLAQRIAALSPNGKVLDMYGLTEAGGIVATKEVSGPSSSCGIGDPLRDVDMFVVDQAGRRIPPGGIGELCVARPGLGPGGVRTGDVARRGGTGEITLLGRIDHQIKIRGHRVHPAELEHCLASHPQVDRAIVVAPDRSVIAAHVTVRALGAVGEGELFEFVDTRLPSHYRPARIIIHDALPLGPHGKVDRAALARPGDSPTGTPGDSSTGMRLARIWEQVLGRGDLRLDDDFFALGGTSLLAIDLLGAVNDEFGSRFGWHVLYEASTLGRLAALLDGLELR